MLTTEDQSPLISASELRAILGERAAGNKTGNQSNTKVKVFDIRGSWGSPPSSSYEDYVSGHIPGAVYLDWITRFLEPGVATGLASVAAKEDAQAAFEELGICKDDTVVLYDDYHHMLAGRVWWAMRYWGFSNVKVLNGGWQHWSAQNYPVSKEATLVELEGDFVVLEQTHLSVSVDKIASRDESVFLIDGRGPIGYGGKQDDPKTGHIPGAINVPYSTLIDSDTHLFKDSEAIAEVFNTHLFGESDGRLDQANIISSCGSGYAGTVLLLALKEQGVDAPLFDGSFAVWKQDESRLIEQGPFV